MKYLILSILLALSPLTDINKIAKINKLKQSAKEAYTSADYQTAITQYRTLVDSLGVAEDEIRLNLANAYYNTKDSMQAMQNYSQLTTSKDKVVKSIAHQQMGILEGGKQKYEQALDQFKEALKANPKNEDARYNYELIKKKLKDQQQQDQQDQQDQNQDNKDQNKEDQQNKDEQNKDQQKKDEQNKEDQDKDGQKQENQEEQGDQEENKEGKEDQEKEGKDQEQQKEGDEKEESDKQKEGQKDPKDGEQEEKEQQPQPSAQDMKEEGKISEEKARMILEAMKNNEIQYIQQNRRKPAKRKQSGKPDW